MSSWEEWEQEPGPNKMETRAGQPCAETCLSGLRSWGSEGLIVFAFSFLFFSFLLFSENWDAFRAFSETPWEPLR